MRNPSLGEQELALLRHISGSSALSVGEVATGYGDLNGLARSTIDTMMERLCKKGYLKRSRQDGVFRYAATSSQQELMSGLVQQFVERTLTGSLTPLVTYFSRQNRLSESELAELERLVEKLQSPIKEAENERSGVDHVLE